MGWVPLATYNCTSVKKLHVLVELSFSPPLDDAASDDGGRAFVPLHQGADLGLDLVKRHAFGHVGLGLGAEDEEAEVALLVT